ncbi:acyltransferase [Sinanaerobacter sp. ZZT-01]|uniref:acyltransferase n=1 Tax=Sinanaerobacter sp. ZZT-01 TaxID=3111540 RepID=UPI002D7954EA|nr:acyltransferase [Sinanaerobacter sp. ZZT-01]WRR92232.1 acyltransferase [Sinanaerobacter sp. ZZT-01]
MEDKLQQQSSSIRKRLIGLDFYKAIGAILVIFIHVTATPVVSLAPGISLDILIFINRFAKPAVPMFIFASGMALFYSYKNKEFQYTTFLKRRFTKIFIPYLAWCAVYYACYVYRGVYPVSLTFFVQQVLNGRMLYHLYFVVTIIQFYFLFGIIRYLVMNYSGRLILPLGILINLLAYRWVPLDWTHRCFLTYIVYFLPGCYFAKDFEQAICYLKKYFWLITSVFVVSGIYYSYLFYCSMWKPESYSGIEIYVYCLFCVMGILFYFALSYFLEKRSGIVIKKIFNSLNAGSYYIYLSHPLAIIFAAAIANRIGLTGVIDGMLLQLALISVTAIPLSILYAKLKSRMKRT